MLREWAVGGEGAAVGRNPVDGDVALRLRQCDLVTTDLLGQPLRLGEKIALTLLAPIDRLLPAKLRPIDAAVVARAMRRALRSKRVTAAAMT